MTPTEDEARRAYDAWVKSIPAQQAARDRARARVLRSGLIEELPILVILIGMFALGCSIVRHMPYGPAWYVCLVLLMAVYPQMIYGRVRRLATTIDELSEIRARAKARRTTEDNA